MIDYLSATTNNNGSAYPDTLTINATGAGTGDGTEMVKIVFDQIWGSQYALMDAAGLTPDSVTEATGTSQILEAIRKISGSPGEGVMWWKNADPATTGDRVLLLTGQVVLIANYPELISATYVGDGNNPTASAFYKTSDAGGTTRSISGTYFVLPDTRGYFLRGLDIAASIDPDGATRDLGNVQGTAMWAHVHQVTTDDYPTGSHASKGSGPSTGVLRTATLSAGTWITRHNRYDEDTALSTGVPVVSSESRPYNIAVTYGIRY